MVRIILLLLFIVNISVAQEGTYEFLESKDRTQKNYVIKIIDMSNEFSKYYIAILLDGRHSEDDVVIGGLKAELFLIDPFMNGYRTEWRMSKRWIVEECYVEFNHDLTILSTYFDNKKLNAKYKIIPHIKVLSPRSEY